MVLDYAVYQVQPWQLGLGRALLTQPVLETGRGTSATMHKPARTVCMCSSIAAATLDAAETFSLASDVKALIMGLELKVSPARELMYRSTNSRRAASAMAEVAERLQAFSLVHSAGWG